MGPYLSMGRLGQIFNFGHVGWKKPTLWVLMLQFCYSTIKSLYTCEELWYQKNLEIRKFLLVILSKVWFSRFWKKFRIFLGSFQLFCYHWNCLILSYHHEASWLGAGKLQEKDFSKNDLKFFNFCTYVGILPFNVVHYSWFLL